MIDNISDEWSDDAMRWDDGIIDDIIDIIADDVAAFQTYKIQSYAGKSGRQICDDIPDDVMNDITDDIVGLIEYKLKSYVQLSGYSGPMPDDIKTVILDKVPRATRRKWLRELQTNDCILQADASKSAQNSDMLNEPAVYGILNLGQSMSDINITISGQVISIGVDDLDSAYKKLKIYGAKMQHQNNRRYLIIHYGIDGNDHIFINGTNGIIEYVQVTGLRALKCCRIDGYKYKDTLDDFMARHGKPGNRFEDRDSGKLYYKYYYDDTRRRFMTISASDDYTIDEIEVFFHG